MSELPTSEEPDEIDDLYRRASALDSSRPSDSLRRAVLEHAATLARQRSAEDIPARLGAAPEAANQGWRRPALYGSLAAALLAGLLITPQFLPPRAPKDVTMARTEAVRPSADAALPPESPAPPQALAPPPSRSPGTSSSPLPPPSVLPPSPAMAQSQSMAKARNSADGAASSESVPLAASNQDKASSEDARSSQGARSSQEEGVRPGNASGDAPPTLEGMAGAHNALGAFARLSGAYPRDPEAALRQAAEVGDVRELRVQLDRHPNVDARDAGGRTALMLATLHGQVPTVEALLAAGADPNAADAGGVTPLQAAVGANQPSIAQALRRAGAK